MSHCVAFFHLTSIIKCAILRFMQENKLVSGPKTSMEISFVPEPAGPDATGAGRPGERESGKIAQF